MTPKGLRRQVAAFAVTAVFTAAVAAGQDVSTGSEDPNRSDPHTAQISDSNRTNAAEEPGLDLPVSIERVRDGLERESHLAISPVRPPDFHVRIEGPPHFDLERAIVLSQKESMPPFTPAYGIDLLSLFRSGMHAMAERNARETVRHDMLEFCRDHPNQPETLPICVETSSKRP
jgi:hypothetical protein